MKNSKLLIEFIRESSNQIDDISEIVRNIKNIPDSNTSKNTEEYADIDASILDEAIGWPYYWSKGAPNTPWADGRKGVDCAGFVEMALVKLGLLSSSYQDRNVASLVADSVPIATGQQRVGDIGYYGKHVTIVCGPPGPDGHSPVLSAGGKGSGKAAKGNIETAKVSKKSRGNYWNAFQFYMRLKDDKR